MSVVLAMYFIALNSSIGIPMLAILSSQPINSVYSGYGTYNPATALGLGPWTTFYLLALPSIAGVLSAGSVQVSEWISESVKEKKAKTIRIGKRKS